MTTSMANLKEGSNIRVLDPADPATQMGPLISENHYQKVMIISNLELMKELSFLWGEIP